MHDMMPVILLCIDDTETAALIERGNNLQKKLKKRKGKSLS